MLGACCPGERVALETEEFDGSEPVALMHGKRLKVAELELLVRLLEIEPPAGPALLDAIPQSVFELRPDDLEQAWDA